MPVIFLPTKIFKFFVLYCYFWRVFLPFKYCRLFLYRPTFLPTMVNAELFLSIRYNWDQISTEIIFWKSEFFWMLFDHKIFRGRKYLAASHIFRCYFDSLKFSVFFSVYTLFHRNHRVSFFFWNFHNERLTLRYIFGAGLEWEFDKMAKCGLRFGKTELRLFQVLIKKVLCDIFETGYTWNQEFGKK